LLPAFSNKSGIDRRRDVFGSRRSKVAEAVGCWRLADRPPALPVAIL
jgi:hypothetical protein